MPAHFIVLLHYSKRNIRNGCNNFTNQGPHYRSDKSWASYLHELLNLYSILNKCVDMRIVSFSEARNNLKTVLDHVVEDADYTIITRRDAEDAVVVSLEYFNSLLETVYLLKSPANAAHLERSIAQFKEGEVLEHELLSD
jgi:antitoxin YefM